MSDHLSLTLQKKTEEFKVRELEKKNFPSSEPLQDLKKSESFGSVFSIPTDEIITEINNQGFTNQLSGIGEVNKNRMENGQDSMLDTRYLKQTTDYQEVSKDERLTDLQREFAEERYKRKKFFGGYKEDSAEMKEVKNKLSEMVDYLNEPVQVGFMEDAAQILSNLYRELIKSCNDYLKGHGSKGFFTSTGTLRRQMVERIRNSASKESALIVSIAKNTEDSMKAQANKNSKKGKNGEFLENMTWENMLFECRARHYSTEKGDDIGVVGGGTSTVFVVKMENKNFFFKDKEDLKEDTVESKEKAVLENIAMQKTLGKISKDDASWVEEKIKKMTLSYKHDINDRLNESEAKLMMESFRMFDSCYNNAKTICQKNKSKLTLESTFAYYLNSIKEQYGLDYGIDDYKYSKILADIRSLYEEVLKDENKLKAIKMGFGALSKEYVSMSVMKEGVKLPKGASITNNNVVTSRVADLLGVSELVCKSETTVLNVEGKTKVGNLMEGAEGGYIEDIKHEKHATTYSGKAKKQLLSLSVLDYIMGQIDRHHENYYVTHEKKGNRMIITGIKGIDNDACCGTLRPDEIEGMSGGRACLQRLTKGKTFNLPAIDYNFAKTVMALTPEVLKYELADLIMPEQISAMIERLSFVQSKVGEVITLYEKGANKDAINKKYKIKILETDDEWESLGSTQAEEKKLKSYNSYLFRENFRLSTKIRPKEIIKNKIKAKSK